MQIDAKKFDEFFFPASDQLLNLTALSEFARNKEFHDSEMKDIVTTKILSGFSNYLKKLNFDPVLCELAMISDQREYIPLAEQRSSRQFMSFIQTYPEVLSLEQASQLKSAWIESIEALSRSDSESGESTDYIVLNRDTYRRFLFRGSISAVPGDCGRDAKPSSENGAVLTEIVAFSRHDERMHDGEGVAETAIEKLIAQTVSRISPSVAEKINEGALLIFPFSRHGGFGEIEKLPGVSVVLDSYSPAAHDPAGCLFVITKSRHGDREQMLRDEERFTNYVQHVLTQSALIESRNNIIKYDRDLRSRNFGQYLHQFNKTTDRLVFYFERALSLSNKESKPLVNVVSGREFGQHECAYLASEESKYISRIAGLAIEAAKREHRSVTAASRKDAMSDSLAFTRASAREIVSQITEELVRAGERLTSYREVSDLQSEYVFRWTNSDEGWPSKLIELSKNLGLSECGKSEGVDWIGGFIDLVAQEVATNIFKHGTRIIDRTSLSEGWWGIYVRDGVCYFFAVNNIYEQRKLERAQRFANKTSDIRLTSTGLAQLRLSTAESGLSHLIDVGVSEALSGAVFWALVPVGQLNSINDGGVLR